MDKDVLRNIIREGQEDIASVQFELYKRPFSFEENGRYVLTGVRHAGKSYMLLGTIWGSIRCGGNEIENRAPYWVAVDYLQRARTADPSLADEANRLIGQYSRYFPATADAFMYDVQDGQSYTVSCGGLRATTTVRTQK